MTISLPFQPVKPSNTLSKIAPDTTSVANCAFNVGGSDGNTTLISFAPALPSFVSPLPPEQADKTTETARRKTTRNK